MAIIEYDHSPNISPEQRLRSLADSVRRAFEELESEEQTPEIKECKPVTLEELGGYPKTGGTIDGDVLVKGSISFATEYAEELYAPLFGSAAKSVKILDLIFHVGYVIATTNSNFDPNQIFTWQTWERFAQGKTLVGVDENDADFASATLEGGEKTHTLNVAEIPSHNHKEAGWNISYKDGITKVAGSGSTYSWGANNGYSTDATGGDGAHNNLQPYTTVYYWRRIETKEV